MRFWDFFLVFWFFWRDVSDGWQKLATSDSLANLRHSITESCKKARARAESCYRKYQRNCQFFYTSGPGNSIHFCCTEHQCNCKVDNILKGSLDLISSPSPSVKIQTMGGKVCLKCKGKTLLGVVNKLMKTKSLLTSTSSVLLITSSELCRQ